MTAYELMIKTNHHLIRGGGLTGAEKTHITRQLLAAKTAMGSDPWLYDGAMNAHMPAFFVPPYNNGKKLKTVIPMGAQTAQVSDNSYELEIIRLLHIFNQPNHEIASMVAVTENRLKQLCFGYKDCFYAECFHAAMVVLRFVSSVMPSDTHWIKKQIAGYNKHHNDRRWHSGVHKYYWLCLSEMPYDVAEPEIHRQKERIAEQLSRSYIMKHENDDIPLYAMRNALARLPEYSYLKDRHPYVDEKTKRLHFNMA